MILALILDAYTTVVFLAVVLSWLGLSPDNPVVRVCRALTEPVLEPIRKALRIGDGIDFSPMILLIGLQLLRRVLFR
ncbi:MAG TPA: YggT family protein [Polyangiaceae bacterium]